MSASTIFALSSAAGRAGIAVIRVSGPAAGLCLTRLTGALPETRRACVRVIRDPATAEAIDRALVLWLPAPGSVTGEDMAELHVHGGVAVIRGVFDALASLPGVRLADAGEFTRRAFENGKLDLTQVEGLADLIEAETLAQRRQALRQSDGHLSRIYAGWREDILNASALMEAAIDFSDEADVAIDAGRQASGIVAGVVAAVRQHLTDGHRGEIIRDGFQVVLSGPPNSGKSSLINSLARRDVAIVSAEAGTTRDVLDVRLDLDGLAVVVSDTAGLREARGAIEAEGIRRALSRARGADLIVWLVDATAPDTTPPDAIRLGDVPVVVVANKIDIADPGWLQTLPRDGLQISAMTGAGIDALTQTISCIAREQIGANELAPLTQVRHRQALTVCHQALAEFADGALLGDEIRADALRRAATALGRLTGRIDVEDVLGAIFGRFCIGK